MSTIYLKSVYRILVDDLLQTNVSVMEFVLISHHHDKLMIITGVTRKIFFVLIIIGIRESDRLQD